MKISFTQILTIAALLNQFISELRANLGSTTGGQRKEVIVQAVINALPLLETITGKDLLDNNKFIAAVGSVADLLLRAPLKTTKGVSFKVDEANDGLLATLES